MTYEYSFKIIMHSFNYLLHHRYRKHKTTSI
nr:MAG TPA: hypothetical protein [Caudoviricetes sp.]